MGTACGRSSSCIIRQSSLRNVVGVIGKRSQEMVLKVFDDKNSLAKAAAEKAAAAIRSAIRDRGQARVIAATGTSQFEFLATLTESSDIDWGRVELFHLDEYIGLPATHPASFRKILLERLVNKTGIAKFHPLNGDARDLSDVIRRVGVLAMQTLLFLRAADHHGVPKFISVKSCCTPRANQGRAAGVGLRSPISFRSATCMG